MNDSNASASLSHDSTPGLDAYESLLSEIASVQEAEFMHINIDVPSAAVTALGALPAVRALRPEIDAALKNFDFTRLDKLEAYARAAWYAHASYVATALPTETTPELVEEATRVRDMLYSDAQALAHRGILHLSLLRGFKTSTGYKSLATDLMGLASIMKANWEKIAANAATKESDITAALSLADRMADEVAKREQAPALLAASTLNRQRAWTLFFRAHDEVRRAVTHVRWHHQDAESILPSLYSVRANPKRRVAGEESTEPTATVPATAEGSGPAGNSAAALGLQPIVPIEPIRPVGAVAAERV